MSKQTEQLAQEVADEQAAMEQQTETTRERVIRIGKLLRKLQAEQKKEQAETGQTWKEWCEEQKRVRDPFPHHDNCRRYILIAKYPGAYERGMSIKEAYKMAGKWKKNGGNKPKPEKVTIKKNLPSQLATAVGRCLNKLEKYNAIEDWDELCRQEKWTDDGSRVLEEALLLCRQEINQAIKKIRQVRGESVALT